MIEQFSRVKVIHNKDKFLNDAMIDWINDHLDRIFKVEKIADGCAKLFKVDFWISLDLLEEITNE